MSFAKKLSELAEYTIEVEGLAFRLVRLRAGDLILQGFPRLALPPMPAPEGAPLPEPAPSEVPVLLAELARGNDALVCATVRAARVLPADPWEALRFVSEEPHADPEANPARVWIGSLPAAVVKRLAEAIRDQDGRAVAALASFRGGSAPPAAPGPAGEAV